MSPLRPSAATTITLCLTLLTLSLTTCAPIKKKPNGSTTATGSQRQHKSLGFYDYIQPEDVQFTGGGASYDQAGNYAADAVDEDADYDYEGNELSSRTLPNRKRLRPRPVVGNGGNAAGFNSPIYYIRLPPQPYMFVPGIGYVSQPPPSPVQQFLNLPVSFVANGKPASIYQWSSGLQSAFTDDGLGVGAPPPQPPMHQRPLRPAMQPTQSKPDSTIHRLPGQYAFNGKPEDIFVLRDSYNSLYSDALQNFYP